MKVAVCNLGCKVNKYECDCIVTALRRMGHEVVTSLEPADAYIVNTCAVTGEAERKSRQFVTRCLRQNPSATVAVIGCASQHDASAFRSKSGVTYIGGVADKAAAAVRFCEKATDVAPLPLEYDGLCAPAEDRTRAYIKVQDGCDNFCAYCTVPYARGRSRNVPIAECVENARKIAAEGVKEIVLTGVNTGDFGRTTGESFLELLQALDAVPGIGRYRISSIEPNLITEEIIDWIASGTKFQPHFHIPLQTGSDELLRRMGRKYDTALFAWKLEYIRRSMEMPGSPKVFFGIDLMTGLPGETEGLFMESLGFLEKIRPAFIHVFPYSRRPGTPAASMPGQVPEAEKHRRVAAVEELCARLHTEFIEANRGIREKVLFESTDRGGLMEGYTGNYIRVSRPYDPELVGKLVEVVL